MSAKKVLIADYDRSSLESLSKALALHKLDVVTATDGQLAYEKYRTEKPDLIVLEAMLPKLHGFDLSSKINEETKGSVPIIIITGLYKGTQYKNEALRSFGASDYFEKPFDEDKLLSSVMKLLSDEPDIDENLPSPREVIEILSNLLKERRSSSSRKEE
jgi:DNA-binding response OmpR family regulator